MSNKGKLACWIIAFAFSLSMIAVDHRGVQAGEYFFQLLGLPVTSGVDGSGLHYVSVTGMLLLLASGFGLYRHLKSRFRYPGRKMIIAAIGYVLIFPSVAYWALLVFHWNTNGLDATDFSKKSSCNIQTAGEIVTYSCELMLINYSRDEQQLAIKPIVDHHGDHKVDIIEKTISLQAQSHPTYYLEFKSKPIDFSIGGFSSEIGVQFRQGDDVKEIRWY